MSGSGRYYWFLCPGRMSVSAAMQPLSPDGGQQTVCGYSAAENK